MIKGKVVHLGKLNTEGRIIKETNYGYGEFATRDYKENEIVYKCDITLIPEDISHYTFETAEGLFVEEKPEVHYVYRNGCVYRYSDQLVNHSCNPNLKAKCDTFDSNGESILEMIASRDIKNGEELTCNYNLFFWDINSKHSFKCLCKSENCCGEVKGFKALSKETQKELIKYADEVVSTKYYESCNI